jgi:hypothetical protein
VLGTVEYNVSVCQGIDTGILAVRPKFEGERQATHSEVPIVPQQFLAFPERSRRPVSQYVSRSNRMSSFPKVPRCSPEWYGSSVFGVSLLDRQGALP